MRAMANPVKQDLRKGRKTCGGFLQTMSPVAAEIMARAGFDWLIVDLEHAPGDFANLQTQLQAMSCADVVPFARAPWNDAVTIKRILDTGVMGVLVPYVNTRAEAIAAVAACKYPPKGVRGVAGSPRAAGYTANAKAYLESANNDVIVIIAVETPEAIANLDEILDVDDLDGIFIGPMDLATSMGFLGDPGRPEVQAAIEEIEEKVRASDKFLGTVATSWAKAQQCYDAGYQWLILMQDGVALHQAASGIIDQFHNQYGDG